MSVARQGQFTAIASFKACGEPSLWLGSANKSQAHILNTHSALLNPFISMISMGDGLPVTGDGDEGLTCSLSGLFEELIVGWGTSWGVESLETCSPSALLEIELVSWGTS